MNKRRADDHCFPMDYLCNDAAEIVLREQANLLLRGKFRGRSRVVEMIILQWNQANLSLSDLGTDNLDTGKI